MNALVPTRVSVVALILALTASGFAADGPPATRDLDSRIDQAIVRTINIGAPIYNQGDAAGCYRLYQGSLIMIEPLLGHRPELAREVAKGLKDVELVPTYAQRATDLRRILDHILSAVRTPVATSPSQSQPQPQPQPLPPPRPEAKPLWSRLGGEPAVKAVVHDFVVLATSDPQVDFTRGGRYSLDAAAVANLEKLLVALVSSATGGPLKYEGRSMNAVHQGMAITGGQFDALAGDLAVVLQKYNVPRKEADELLAIVASTRKEIVTGSLAATSAAPPPPAPTPTAGIPLWSRLGGEPAVKAVVHDFVALAASDPQVDFTRGGKYVLDAPAVAKLEKRLVELISAVSGGPLTYEGQALRPAHQGMAITDAQFDALARDLGAVLQKYNVPRKEADELLAIVASTRKDVVEPGPRVSTPER
jgi:hemoglobin